jgi:hypothetical protein
MDLRSVFAVRGDLWGGGGGFQLSLQQHILAKDLEPFGWTFVGDGIGCLPIHTLSPALAACGRHARDKAHR